MEPVIDTAVDVGTALLPGIAGNVIKGAYYGTKRIVSEKYQYVLKGVT